MSIRQITIAVDAMGGENSPFKTLKGSEIFSMYNKNVRLLFFLCLVDFWFGIDFDTIFDQKCHLASTKCTSMSILNVKRQGFCNAFSNFLTFFQSKRTSRCPKLIPNHYFCSPGDPFFEGFGIGGLFC